MIHSFVNYKALSLDTMNLGDGDISTCFAIVYHWGRQQVQARKNGMLED